MDPVEAYARSVVAGDVPAGKYHKASCARHLRDLTRQQTAGFPYRFDIKRAERVWRFCEKLKHYKGEWAGQLLKLEPHQKFRKGCKFGWVHAETGLRRFRNAYEEIPRKNGKSFDAAQESLYVTFFDGEPGAEGYCLHPDTRVLFADLTWRPIHEVSVGDELLSVDETYEGFKKQRKMRTATVLGKRTTRRYAVKLTFESGRHVICSPDHKWLSQSVGANAHKWRQTRELKTGYRVAYLGEPWAPDTSWSGGYLSGLYDGEGYLHAPQAPGSAFRIGFSQKPGIVLEQCLELLEKSGFRPTAPRPHAGGTMEMSLTGLHSCLRFLGSIRPRRLWAKSRLVWEGKTFPGMSLAIEKIELIGQEDLIDIETTTRTFIAEGFVSHNCVATKRDQARVVFGDCRQLVMSSGLRDRLVVQMYNIHHPGTHSKLEPLSSDYDSMDGLNPNMVNLDELHAYKNRGTIDVMETATGSRRQPLINKITTAGDDLISVCGSEHKYACEILDGVRIDETYYTFIAHADEGDPWTSLETARKANPNYGVSVKPGDLQSKIDKAMGIPEAAATYQQKHLNLWVNTSAPSLSIDGWTRGQSNWDPDELLHEPCWVGIDLSSNLDLTSMSLVFPPATNRLKWLVLQYIWTPADTIVNRAHQDQAPYQVWVDQGWLKTSPGTQISYDLIREALAEARHKYDIQAIGYDPWHAPDLIHRLHAVDGFPEEQMVEVPQTISSLTNAEKYFKAEVLAGRVDARGCPVTARAVSNVVDTTDGQNNIMFSKKKSRGRIDPVKSATIAISVKLRQELPEAPQYQMFFIGRGA